MAALAGQQICMIPMMCENTIGSFECICPTGSEPFNNGTMCRQSKRCCLMHLNYFTDNVWYCLHAVCGENFYRLTETQCSGCPENSVRPLNESDSMCACENGYSRRQEDQIDQPCVRKLK